MRIIAFAGLDGSGKTTIINKLKKLKILNHNNYYFTQEPRIFTSKKLKSIIVPSKLDFLFFFIDRVLHKVKLIKYRNKIIISDRSIVCGIAYSYAVSKFNFLINKMYCNMKYLIPKPSLVIFICPMFDQKVKEFNEDFETKVLQGYKIAMETLKDTTFELIPNEKNKLLETINTIYCVFKDNNFLI